MSIGLDYGNGNARIYKVRSEVVAPGARLVLASINGPGDGIYEVNWALSTNGGSKYSVHYENRGSDDVLLFDHNLGASPSLQEAFVIASARTKVVYENTDTVAHTVSSDVLGWLG